jgi:hypothetical protein
MSLPPYLLYMPYNKSTPEGLKKSKQCARRFYLKNRTRLIAINLQNKAKRLIQIKQWMSDYKSKLVCPCGESHISCLLFHHRDPSQKDIEVSLAVLRGWSIPRLLKEINKCDVMCSNCHNKLHWKEKHPNE